MTVLGLLVKALDDLWPVFNQHAHLVRLQGLAVLQDQVYHDRLSTEIAVPNLVVVEREREAVSFEELISDCIHSLHPLILNGHDGVPG